MLICCWFYVPISRCVKQPSKAAKVFFWVGLGGLRKMMVFSSAVAASMHWLNHFIVAVHILNEEYIHYGFLLFFLALLIVIIPSFQPLFLRRFARSHRWLGLFHLIWLCFGFYLLCIHPFLYNRLSMLLQAVIWIMYDAVLGISGTALTLSASRDFR